MSLAGEGQLLVGLAGEGSSYQRSLFSRIRGSLAHYLTGPETAETVPVTASDLCGIEPLRDEQAHRCIWLIVRIPVVQEGRGL